MILSKKELKNAFQLVGLKQGDYVIAHTSLSKLGYVIGGPQTVIEALLETVGSEGTIMIPTQSWKNLSPEHGVHGDIPEVEWEKLKEYLPAYDKKITPTNTMGAVAEMFRNWPGTVRSDHPARSFAANGAKAEYLIDNHDLSDIFGQSSPLGKLYELDGKVLLIGVGHDKNTSIHLADVLADYPEKSNETVSSVVTVNGQRKWVEYTTLKVDGKDFVSLGKDFERTNNVMQTSLNGAIITCMSQKALVDFSIEWMEKNR
jgi:aminoglycoside 3-N-acetyltransferase